MSYELGSAYITVLPSFNKFKPAMEKGYKGMGEPLGKKTGKEFDKGMGKSIAGSAKKMFAPLAAAAGAVGGAVLFKDLINEASDAQQSIGATEALFGKYSDTVVKKSKEAAQEYGLSANEYRDSSNLLAALFKNQGVEMDQLAGKTDEMVGLGADLAAMYGGTTADAVEAMTAAYKGEFNSLEKYGITMKASTVNAEAMAVANVNSAKEWNNLTTEQQAAATQQATTNLLLKQSGDAQGQASKEANTYAGQMQRLQASLANTKETLGAALLPVVTGFVSVLNKNVVPAVQGFITGMKEGHGWGGKVADVFGTVKGAAETAFGYVKNDVIPALQNFKDWLVQNKDTIIDVAFYVGALGTAVLAYKGYVGAATIVGNLHDAWLKRHLVLTKAQTIAQKALNLVMKMNPIGLVIAAITGLIGILVVAYNRHEGFRNLVDNVWKKIKEVSAGVVNWFKNTAWPVLQDVINRIGSVVKWLWESIYKPYFTFILDKVKAVVGWIKDTAWPWMRDTFANIGSKAGDLKNKAVAAFDGIKSGISNAWDGAKRILDRFKGGLDSLKSKFQNVKDGISRVWSTIGAAIAKPINTVIDTVNRFLNRLQDGINDIPGVNLKGTWGSINPVPVPAGLTSSASTAGRRTSGGAVMLASGGQVPGWSPNDRADNIPAWLTAGEYVLPVKATERLRSMLGADGLEHLRNGQLPAYADGGLIGDGRGGPVGWVKDKWDEVIGFFENAKGWVKGMWNRLMPDFGNSWAGQAVKGIMGNIDLGKIANAVKEKATGGIGGLNASGSGAAMPWQAIWSLVQQIAPEARKTSDHRPGARTAGYGNLSYHARGRAIDIVSNDMMSTYRKVVGALPWSELIFSPAGNRQVRNGRYYMETNPVTRSQHWDHIHLAMAKGGLVPNLYDEGGAIMPGLSLVANQTGKPEMVLTNDQWTDIRDDSGGNTIIINGVRTEDATDVADELLFALKRTGRGKYNRVR